VQLVCEDKEIQTSKVEVEDVEKASQLDQDLAERARALLEKE
jgi:hypothetical protein